MLYIDKDKDERKGNAITDDYLNQECLTVDPITQQARYQNIDYAGSFSSGGYRKRMLRLGSQSQQKYCCYCLRKMGREDAANLEHIIPQSATETAPYETYNGLSHEKTILTSQYISKANQQRPPYPHTVAWHNLVVSCNGCFPAGTSGSSQCCNHARSSKLAPPVYYLKDIEAHVNYMKDGSIRAIDKDVQYTIEAARLNCQPLKEIRKLWFLLRKHDYKDIVLGNHDTQHRYRILLSAFEFTAHATEELRIVKKYQKPEYWKVFMKYHLFYKLFPKT